MHLKIVLGAVLLVLNCVVSFTQQSAVECSENVTFGEHLVLPSSQDASRAVRVEVVYFRSADPNAFISEVNGLKRSGSFRRVSHLEFASLFDRLSESKTLAVASSDTKRATIGERLTFDDKSTGRTELASLNHAAAKSVSNGSALPERRTEVRVVRKDRTARDAYRLLLISAAVDIKRTGVGGAVDLDVNVFLRPGETAIFKLIGDKQIARSGTARDFIAVTLLPEQEK